MGSNVLFTVYLKSKVTYIITVFTTLDDDGLSHHLRLLLDRLCMTANNDINTGV